MDFEELKKRFLSFLWRAGMMVLALFVTFLLDNLDLFHLTPQVSVVVGLVLGEISKMLNQGGKFGKTLGMGKKMV